MSMLILSGYGQQEKDDNLCPKVTNVLCVKDVLLNIINAGRKINVTTEKIDTSHKVTMDRYIHFFMTKIQPTLPILTYHNEFFKRNSIDRADFINLIKEEYYMLSYLYASIENVLEKDNIFASSAETKLKNIRTILKNDFLCNYRSILQVYGETWSPINKIKGFQVTDEQQTINDGMCNATRSVLCVKDVLMMIATVAKSINRTGNEIEKKILNEVETVGTLYRYYYFEMGSIQSKLPTPQYHVQFFQLNNIDTKYLGELLLEAHYAMSFYYNSIEDLLNIKNPLTNTIDTWFKQIHVNLKKEMICRFRSILNVYSHQWPSIDQVKRIEFSRRKYRDIFALAHDVHSIVIIRLLCEWMQRIHSVIMILDKKLD